jgi:DNA topoisomerase-1
MAKDLPAIRKQLWSDLRRKDYSRERICAGVVLLISQGWFRVGSERYEKENNSFGITTLRKSHVHWEGERFVFRYKGKRSIEQHQSVVNPKLIAFVADLMKQPGRRLFRYQEGRKWADLNSREVNDYIEEIAGFPYTAKDFRTWGGSLLAATVLSDLGPGESKTARNKNVVMAVRMVSADLGNTPAICRKSYVHPMILTRYLKSGATIEVPHRSNGAGSAFRHTPEETALIAFLDEHFPDRRTERRTG